MKAKKWILIASMVIGMSLSVGVSSASATLSLVGPHLSSNPDKAKVQVETMLHHDAGVQAFYAGSLGVPTWEIAKAKVVHLRFGHCRIGFNPKCPINTGKNGAGKVVKTDYRFGEVRKVAYVVIELPNAKGYVKITLEAPCVNLLNGGVFVHNAPPRMPHPPHIPVSPKKPIVYRLISVSYSISNSTSSAKAECPAGTVESVAGAGAEAKAEAETTHKFYRQRRHSWKYLYGKIKSISTTTYTNTGSGTSVTCTPSGGPPPPVCENCGPPPVDHAPQISCTFPPHVYVGEDQKMWCEASDPDGDSLTISVEGDSHLQVSSTIPVNERWDKSPCPSGVHCYRSTVYGKSAGTAHVTATVYANGKQNSVEGTIEVPEDEF